MLNLFKFCIFHPISIRFGLGANIGLMSLNEYRFFLTDRTNPPKTTNGKFFNFMFFGLIWRKFGMWTTIEFEMATAIL